MMSSKSIYAIYVAVDEVFRLVLPRIAEGWTTSFFSEVKKLQIRMDAANVFDRPVAGQSDSEHQRE